MSDATMPVLRYDSLPPEAISPELAPAIQELGLDQNCRELTMQGWTVVENVASIEVNDRLRQAIIDASPKMAEGQATGSNMLLTKDPVFAEAALNPYLMAMAEFSVGRGHLLLQMAGSVTPQGSPGIGLHADQNWMPAPFPAHNMIITCCWATDE